MCVSGLSHLKFLCFSLLNILVSYPRFAACPRGPYRFRGQAAERRKLTGLSLLIYKAKKYLDDIALSEYLKKELRQNI